MLPVNLTTGLLSSLLAHWAGKLLYSLTKRKDLLALGVRLADILSPDLGRKEWNNPKNPIMCILGPQSCYCNLYST